MCIHKKLLTQYIQYLITKTNLKFYIVYLYLRTSSKVSNFNKMYGNVLWLKQKNEEKNIPIHSLLVS